MRMNTEEPKVKNPKGFIVLPKKFTSGEWEFEQVWREGLFAIYKKSKGQASHYEAIKIKETNQYEIAGNVIEARESFPNDNDWGVSGFSCPTLIDAHKRIGYMKDNSEEILLKQKEVNDKGEIIVRGNIRITYPQDKEFTIRDLEPLNPDIKKHNIYPALKKLIDKGEIKEVRREKVGKGKPSVIYNKV